LVGKKLFQTVQETATAQGIEDHAQDNSPWIDDHLSGHHLTLTPEGYKRAGEVAKKLALRDNRYINKEL
jgi:hypothetical protein